MPSNLIGLSCDNVKGSSAFSSSMSCVEENTYDFFFYNPFTTAYTGGNSLSITFESA